MPTTHTHYLHLRYVATYRKQFLELAAKGGATIAYQTGVVNLCGVDTVIIKGAISVCVPEDNYCKADGRKAASDLLSDTNLPHSGSIDSERTFFVEVGYLADLATRVVDGHVEILHDNQKIRKLLQAQALGILKQACFLTHITSFDSGYSSKLQVV